MADIITFFINLPQWSLTILTLLFAFLSGLFVYAGKNYLSESKQFRNTIYTELENVYPNVSIYLNADDINTKILNSIPRIVAAAGKFSHFLPFFCKRSFKKAINHYCDTARKIDWNSHKAFNMFPSMRKPNEVSPGDKFKHGVDALLKFAK